jgi:hypothetical protein
MHVLFSLLDMNKQDDHLKMLMIVLLKCTIVDFWMVFHYQNSSKDRYKHKIKYHPPKINKKTIFICFQDLEESITYQEYLGDAYYQI